jgi:hypothetical protein
MASSLLFPPTVHAGHASPGRWPGIRSAVSAMRLSSAEAHTANASRTLTNEMPRLVVEILHVSVDSSPRRAIISAACAIVAPPSRVASP